MHNFTKKVVTATKVGAVKRVVTPKKVGVGQ